MNSFQTKTGWPWDVEPSAQADATPLDALPTISIVTPSFNQGDYIEETIRSVLFQNYPKLEYIVMDGGSTDRTVEVIRRYSDRITHWVSEKDRGQSHAINKGLARCTGDIFNWINSDDMLVPGALWAVARAWMKQPGAIVSGSTEFFNHDGGREMLGARGQTLMNFVRFWEARDLAWAQQGTFLPRAKVQALGGVNEKLRYCMDYHLMVRLLMLELPVAYVDQPLGRFRIHGDSKTVGGREKFRLERVPMLRAIENMPVKVSATEWNREQALRLLDVAIGATREGRVTRGAQLLGRAVATSPFSTARELMRRCFSRPNPRHTFAQ